MGLRLQLAAWGWGMACQAPHALNCGQSVGVGRGLLAWPWAEAFSLSSCSVRAVSGGACQLAQEPGYRAAPKKVGRGSFSHTAEI